MSKYYVILSRDHQLVLDNDYIVHHKKSAQPAISELELPLSVLNFNLIDRYSIRLYDLNLHDMMSLTHTYTHPNNIIFVFIHSVSIAHS